MHDENKTAVVETDEPIEKTDESAVDYRNIKGADLVFRTVSSFAIISIGGLSTALIMYFANWELMLILAVLALSVFFGVLAIYIYQFILKKGDFKQRYAVCINKTKTGYRRQDCSFDFQVMGSEVDAFEIKSASNKKFKVGFTYRMVFKGKNPDLSSSPTLLGFEHIGSNEFTQENSDEKAMNN